MMIAITIQVGCEPFLPHDLKERGMIQREIFGSLPKDTSCVRDDADDVGQDEGDFHQNIETS